MRKLTSLCMICTLLFISSMPTVALAAMCNISDFGESHLEEMAMAQSGEHHSNSMMKQQMKHADYIDQDWQTCRIECGCGCHRHLDSLPHQFSPHIISKAFHLPKTPAIEIIKGYAYSDYFYVPDVQLPPPDLS